MSRRVVHLTSVHQWHDVRIFPKMARSLARAGFETHIVALDRRATAEREFVEDGVKVHLLPGADIGSRLRRALTGGRRVAAKARALRADIVHLHDPELIPFLFGGLGGKAKRVYDAHEDLVGQIDAKQWIGGAARPMLKATARLLELAARHADGLITATPVIARRFGARAVTIENFPLLGEFDGAAVGPRPATATITAIYAGGISRARGISALVEAIGQASAVDALHLAGTFQPPELQGEIEKLPGWRKVRFHGQLPRADLARLMAQCDVGLVALLPNKNYFTSHPTKLFEYLSAGLLVVASDFPTWREFLDADRLAELVDPADPASIADGLARVAALPEEERERRRAAGRRLIAERINWEAEARKLVDFYERL